MKFSGRYAAFCLGVFILAPAEYANAQDEATAPPPIHSEVPPSLDTDGARDKPSLYDIMIEFATARLDDDKRGAAIANSIPFALEIDEAEIARLYTRNEVIHRSAGIDVPLRLLEPDAGTREGSVWYRGPMPRNGYMGAVKAQALSAATAQITWKDGSKGDVTLYEARFVDLKDPRSLTSLEGRIYCAADIVTASGDMALCLIDRNEDGSFDEAAGIAEASGSSVHSATVLSVALPLADPAPYSTRTENLPTLEAQWVTCGKDYDRPYYSIHLAADELGTVREYSASNGSYVDPYCAKAEPAAHPLIVGDKALGAKMGPAIARISSKSDGGRTRIVTLSDPDQAYRVERGDRIVPLSDGWTENQARLATVQRFDRRPYQATGTIEKQPADFGIGHSFLVVDFRHGYTGTVAGEIRIDTLFSSRSVAGGTPVYAVPAELRDVLVGTYGGETILGPKIKRTVKTSLVWCLPSREELALDSIRYQRSGGPRIRWTATCLPENSSGDHTILKDQSPALAVRDLSMNANITTNDGAPPVVQTDTADFGGALSFRYTVKEVEDSLYQLEEEVLLGEEVTSTSSVLLLRHEDGRAFIEAGGGIFTLKPAEEGSRERFVIETVRPVQPGKDARLKGFDFEALRRALDASRRDRR